MSLGTSVLKCRSNLNLLWLQNFALSKKCKFRGSASSNGIFSKKEVAVTAFPADTTLVALCNQSRQRVRIRLSDNALAIAGLKSCNASLQSLVTITLQTEGDEYASKLHPRLHEMDFFVPCGVVSSYDTARNISAGLVQRSLNSQLSSPPRPNLIWNYHNACSLLPLCSLRNLKCI